MGAGRHDGFISTRGDSRKVGERLIDALADSKTEIIGVEQGDCDRTKKSDHLPAAQKLIAKSKFCVVLIGPSRLKPQPNSDECYQLDEIEAIRDRQSRAEKDKKKFLAIPVFLQDAAGTPAFEELKSLFKSDSSAVDEDVIDWLVNEKSAFALRGSFTSAAFKDDMKKLVRRIRSFCVDNFAMDDEVEEQRPDQSEDSARRSHQAIVKSAAPQMSPPQKSPPPEVIEDKRDPDSVLNELEHAYLLNAVKHWSHGQIDGQVESRKRASGNAFEFEAGRFVEFTAVQDHQDGSRDRSADTQNLSFWLLKPQAAPLVLEGEAGAGKTTALAAAACAFAAEHGGAFAKYCERLAEKEWLATSREMLANCPKYVPVLMRCSDISAQMGDAGADSDALMDAIIRHMRAGAKEPVADVISRDDRVRFGRRLQQQAYVFLFDGLDGVGDAHKAKDLFNAANNLTIDLRDAGSGADEEYRGARAIFTTRPDHGLQIDAKRVQLAAPLTSWQHIETFIARFVKTSGASNRTRLRDRLISQAQIILDIGDARNAPLQTPLFLNAFCCVAMKKDVSGAHRHVFCGQVIEYFLEGRKFTRLAERAGDQKEMARRVLRWLAFACISDKGVTKIALDQVERQLCQEAARLGLGALSVLQAGELLDELAVQTSLFDIDPPDVDHRARELNFRKAMFCEYLAGEQMADGELNENIRNARDSDSWRSVILFAAALQFDRSGANEAVARETPAVLLAKAEQADNENATWFWAHLALEVLAERSTVHAEDALQALLERMVVVFRGGGRRWQASRRATFADLLFRLSRRTTAEEGCTAIEHLLELFLAPRRPWIAVDHPEAPAGFQIADTPVLVAQYRRFLEDVARGEERFWPHAPTPEERLMISDPVEAAGLPAERRDSWIVQMERPGSPVVNISWYEAVAYALWLTERLHETGALPRQERLRLPSEGEWEALMKWVSRGAPYPWGHESPKSNPERINWLGADVDHPSAPGVFEATGVEGLYDLGSNVACWTVPHEGSAVWPPNVAKLRSSAGEKFASTNGGSWTDRNDPIFRSRAAAQLRPPAARNNETGFRLVRTPISN